MEYVVTEHKAYTVITNKFAAYYECLCQSFRAWLLRIRETYSEVAAVTQQAAERWQVFRSLYNKYVAYTGIH